MKNKLKTSLLCAAIALVGLPAAAQGIQPIQGDGTVASQTEVIDEETGLVIGFIIAGVFIAAGASGGGGGGGGGGDEEFVEDDDFGITATTTN